MQEKKEAIRNAIKNAIKKKGWTMKDVADRMRKERDGVVTYGISQPTLSAIINGNPTLDKLQEIAAILGVPLSDLVSTDQNELLREKVVCPGCGMVISIKATVDMEPAAQSGTPEQNLNTDTE